MPLSKPYSSLAIIYDHLMSRIRYDRWAEYILEITKGNVSKNAKVLELSAGSCKIARHLSKYYHNYILSDVSIEMLKEGDDASLPKVCCDCKDLPFNTKFDLVISTFDSINYLLKKNDLIKLFAGIRNIISDNGIFVFDVCLEKNSYDAVKLLNREGEYNGITYKQISSYDPVKRIHTNKFIMHTEKSGKLIEYHIQKIYPFNTYFEIINKCGLFVSECFEIFTKNNAVESSKRIQFIVKKVNSHAELQ